MTQEELRKLLIPILGAELTSWTMGLSSEFSHFIQGRMEYFATPDVGLAFAVAYATFIQFMQTELTCQKHGEEVKRALNQMSMILDAVNKGEAIAPADDLRRMLNESHE